MRGSVPVGMLSTFFEDDEVVAGKRSSNRPLYRRSQQMRYTIALILQMGGMAELMIGLYWGLVGHNIRGELILLCAGVAMFYAGRFLMPKRE